MKQVDKVNQVKCSPPPLGDYSTKFYTGCPVPRSNPLPFYTQFLTKEVHTPFVYLLLKNNTIHILI